MGGAHVIRFNSLGTPSWSSDGGKAQRRRGSFVGARAQNKCMLTPIASLWAVYSSSRGANGIRICLYVYICMCGSAHDCGCVIDGSNAMTASWNILLWIYYGVTHVAFHHYRRFIVNFGFPSLHYIHAFVFTPEYLNLCTKDVAWMVYQCLHTGQYSQR